MDNEKKQRLNLHFLQHFNKATLMAHHSMKNCSLMSTTLQQRLQKDIVVFKKKIGCQRNSFNISDLRFHYLLFSSPKGNFNVLNCSKLLTSKMHLLLESINDYPNIDWQLNRISNLNQDFPTFNLVTRQLAGAVHLFMYL